MDLHDELEDAIGHGPALPPPVERLASGRRALRRRRAVVAAGAAAAVAAVVLPVAALAGGTPTSGGEPAPAAPPATASATPTPSVAPRLDIEPKAQFERSLRQVAYADLTTGELMIDPRAEVLHRIDDLYPGKDTQSVALDLLLRGEREWVVLEWDEGGSSGTLGGPDDDFYTGWDDFLAKATSGGGMTDGPPPRNRGGGGDDQPVPGEVTGLRVKSETFSSDGSTTILEQRPSPDLPETFAMPGEATAAAYVEQDGERYLVLSRPDQLIAVESAGHGDSLDALLAWARERYESGEGLL